MSAPYDWEREEALEAAWREGVTQWTLEIIGTPGLFASQCHADCLDEMGSDAFVAWYNRQADR